MKYAQPAKRFLTFFLALALLLSLAGCGTTKAKTVISQDTLLCYPGLRWNMTPEEVLAALGRTESDAVPEERLPEEDNGDRYIFSLTGLELFGQTVNAVFAFLNKNEEQCGLEYVYVLFPNSADFDAVRDSLTEQLGDPTLPPNENPDVHRLAWDSTETLNPFLDTVYPGLPHQRTDASPAARVFWTDDPQWYFKSYGLSEPGWKQHYTETNLLVFEGFLTDLLQHAQIPTALSLEKGGWEEKKEGEPDIRTLEFPGLQWGMTPEEAAAALSLKKDSWEEKKEGTYLRLEGIRMALFDGYDSWCTLYFLDQNGDGVYTLCRVLTVFPNGTDMEKVKSAVAKRYGEPSEDSGSRALWNSQALHQDIMTSEEAEFLKNRGMMTESMLAAPVTTISWTTNSYFDYPLDSGTTKNELAFTSAVAFYTREGGYTAQLEAGS